VQWSSADVDCVLLAAGFELARRAAHDTYTRPGHPRTVSVPRNRKAMAPGTLASIWRQAGLSRAAAEALQKERCA
jgi:predicted RNA binding protein YcfA (HicA-like mRNA interferase family)